MKDDTYHLPLSSNKISAFTLIELLVVIAIISILAAILFPVFSSAKIAAKQIVCISNLKQISIAMHLYRNDHDGMSAMPYNGPENLGPGFSPLKPWIGYDNGTSSSALSPPRRPIHPGQIDPYLKNNDVMGNSVKRCPMQKPEWQLTYTASAWVENGQTPAIFPQLRGKEFGAMVKRKRNGSAYYEIPTNESEVQRPAQTLAVWHHENARTECGDILQREPFLETVTETIRDHLTNIHRDGNIFIGIWDDGHVAATQVGRLKRYHFVANQSIFEGLLPID